MLRNVAIALVAAVPLFAEVPLATPHSGGSSELNTSPFVASNGSTFAVAWGGDALRVAIHDLRGNAVARVERLTYEQAFPEDIGAIGSDYVFIYGTSNLLHAAIIGQDGTVRANREVMPGWTGSVATIGATAIVINERGSATLIDSGAQIIRKDITFAPGESYSPDVAASQSHFFAVWLTAGEIHGARIAPDGTASAPLTIGPADWPGASDDRPSIASNGLEFVVTWKTGSTISAANIDATGVPYAQRVIANDATGVSSIAWNGSDYVIAYPVGTDVRVTALNAGETRVLHRDNRQGHPRVATIGETAFVVREELARCFETWEVVGSLTDRDGTFFISTGTAAQTDAAVATLNGVSAVAFVERGEVWRLRLALSPFREATDIETGFAVPAIAAGTSEFLVAWLAHADDCAYDIRAAIVREDGSVSTVRTVATNVDFVRPAIGWNGSEFLLVWSRGNPTELNAMRIAADGTPVDATPATVTAPVEKPDHYTYVSAFSPSVRWTGAQWQLTWLFNQATYIPMYPYPLPSISDVRTRTLSRDLTTLTAERTIATGSWSPVAAANAPIVVWLDRPGVVAASIGADGSISSPALVSIERPEHLTLACSATECAVGADTRFYRISRDGSHVLDAQTLASPILALTSDGSSFLAVTIRGNPTQLFASESGRLGPRRRSAR